MTTSNEMNEQLMSEWLKKYDKLTEEQSRQTDQLISEKPASVIYKLLEAVKNKKESFSDMISGISYIKENGKLKVTIQNTSALYTEKQLTELFCAAADIFCNVLPTGSVVKLKTDKNDKSGNTDQLIMIDRRFVYANENSKAFYTYSGTLYPFGSFNDCIRFNFTPNAVEEVIHTGYHDETEDAFVFRAKDEMVVKNRMHSFTCASAEDEDEFRKECSGDNKI